MFAVNQIARLSRNDPSYEIVSLLLGERSPSAPSPNRLSVDRGSLNDRQYDAVQGALLNQDVFLIHGPPGCGKTKTVCHLIREAVKMGMKVLACAPSNIAVDGIVEQLAKAGDVRIVRLGHPARILPSVVQHTLDELIARSESFQLASDVRNELRALLVPTKVGTKRRDVRTERSALRAELRQLEARSIEETIGAAQVVLATCVGVDIAALRGRRFDLAIIDEAAQAMEAQCWIGVLRCRRVVLAGDHKQLAPTMKSDAGASYPTMFERVHRLLQRAGADESIVMLERQYRMHANIQAWSSAEFYDGKLVADESVAGHRLSDLGGVRVTDDTTPALIFIDTAGCDLDEDADPNDDDLSSLMQLSKGNAGEARIVAIHVISLLQAGLQLDQIGVLTPYSRQVGLCRQALIERASTTPFAEHIDQVEVGTVDGFQGREKEAIVISTVRSNSDGDIGFLSDQRRMNVACTRARRQLTVIGDSETLATLPFLKRLIDVLENQGDYRPATLYDGDNVGDL